MYHPALLIGAGIIVVGFALYAAINEFNRHSKNTPHETQQWSRDREPSALGVCCHCENDVLMHHGRKTPCGHFIHFTCEAWLRKELPNRIHWELVCTFCLIKKAIKIKKGEQNSVPELGPCCRCKDIVNEVNGDKIPCGHFIHKICVAALRERFSSRFQWRLACKTCLITRANESQRIQRNKVLKISALGSCCRCNEVVDIENGRNTSCGHYVHDTCRSSLNVKFPYGFEWTVVCRICSAACMETAQTQKKRQKRKPSMLGPCSLCDKAVDANKGHKLSCGHFIHNTCQDSLSKNFPSTYDSNMMCKSCLTKQIEESVKKQRSNGLRKRATHGRVCGNCGKNIEGISTVLSCRHEFHENCWQRMKENYSTTCPECMYLTDDNSIE